MTLHRKRLFRLFGYWTAILFAALLLASCSSEQTGGGSSGPALEPGAFSPNTQRLMNYLEDTYGNYIISGQMDCTWSNNGQIDMISRVYEATGKYPAVKGFDMMELPYNWTNYGRQQIDEAIEWWEGKNRVNSSNLTALTQLLPDSPDIHGIVTFCWHWRTPDQFYYRDDNSSRNTSFRIPWKNGKLDTDSFAFKNTIIADLNKAAALLQLLKDRDIPVLWRPLHEAAGDIKWPGSGGWFWWGAKDVSEPDKRYIALWEYMYYYLTNVKKLDNLIWVWNGQNAAWFPNPDTVHIVGYDVYFTPDGSGSAKTYPSQSYHFDATRDMVPDKNRMVALTENGAIPNPDNCFTDNAAWLWFCTWNDSQTRQQITNAGPDHRDNFIAGEHHNTNAHKHYVYNHEKVITLDKLPDITKYRLEANK